MKGPLISSKKINLQSEYSYFDLLPLKKYHQCNMRIPQTIMLEKGFIKDWVFNSHKISNHPILKKKRQNLSTFAVIRAFCIKNGYGQAIQGCTNIRQARQMVKQALKEQKDYDFVKDKKVIEITTVSNEVLVMTLLDFLDYVSENKYSQQNFYQKWKMIQEKVSFTKIDEYYRVQNVRNNHVIQSKCQKIISLNTTEATIQSSELDDDPYKNTNPGKSFQIAETKNIQGYKFFDTFLNKKFFQMSADLIQFIEKNLKCIVQSALTKFVINKDREPFLVSISELQIKPAKKIADMKQFQMAKQKGFLKIEEYEKFLETYVHENMEKQQTYNINTPISQRRKKCKGKFCQLTLEEVNLPSLLQHKLKMPNLSASSRVIQIDLRDAVIKRKRKVIEKLIEHKIIEEGHQVQDQSSQYETEGDTNQPVKQKIKQLKVCQNCYTFYFHVSRFFEVDIYGNLTQKKVAILPVNNGDSKLQKSDLKGLSFMEKQSIKRSRSKNESSNKKLDELSEAFANQKLEAEQKTQFELEIKPITTIVDQISRKSQDRKLKHSYSNPKLLSPIKRQKSLKTDQKIKSQKKLQSNIKSKVKLDPINPSKHSIVEGSLANNPDTKQTKGHRLLALTKVTQPVFKMLERSKSKTMHAGMLISKEKRPDNFIQASEQLIKKLSALPDSSKQQLIYYAKKYYKDNLPQPIERRSYSTYYQPHLYQFMSLSPISIHPKRRIKKRPQMSLKRLSQLTQYPEIVSRSQFIFDTIIINEQTTIPFCVLSTKVVSPDNIKSGLPFENIFIINDIFDCFIQHISMGKQLLEQQQVYNKRIILFDYPGQSHTIYNRGNTEGFSAYFCQVLDKLVFHLSGEKNQLKVIDLDKDNFKFCGFGYGGYLLSTYLGSYSFTYGNRITNVMIVNSFMQYPKRYTEILQSLLQLYRSDDPTVQQQAHLYYNKSINSQQTSIQQMQHKTGLNPIRIQDRIYLLQSVLKQHKQSQTTTSYTIQPQWFEDEDSYQVSIIYGKNNTIISKDHAQQFIRYRHNVKQEINKRIYVEIDGGHDILADNYEDIFRVITLFARK